MKKKLAVIIGCLACCLSVVTPVAAETEGFANEYARVQDMADLLTDEEEAELTAQLDEISERQQVDVIVATTDTLEGATVVEYADDLYDYCGYGYGENADGLLLLISMEDRDWYITTCGYAITAFTDAGIAYIGGQMLSDLSEGYYAQAFSVYAQYCDDFITQARNGEPYDVNNMPKEPLSAMWILISIVVGVLIALIIVGVMKGQLKSVRPQPAANNYIRSGSMKVNDKRDLFLYHTVSRKAKPKESSSSGGGSSTHRSSSGRSHGGGGGKF